MIRLFSKSKGKKIKKPAAATKEKRSKAKSAKTAKDKGPTKGTDVVAMAAPAPVPSAAPRRGKREMTPERERLIRTALMVHASQTKVLDELDDDLKEKLRALAVEKLLGGDDTKH